MNEYPCVLQPCVIHALCAYFRKSKGFIIKIVIIKNKNKNLYTDKIKLQHNV